MVFAFGIWNGADHLTAGELVYVNADIKTKRSTPWPDELKEAILAYERKAPESQ